MLSKSFRVLTWNVNGLQTRFPDLHAHVLLHFPDVIALQEVGPHVPDLRGYTSHVLTCANGSSRGLATYVKLGAAVTLEGMGVSEGMEYITVCLHTQGETVYFVNVYCHAGAFHVTKLPWYVLEEQTVLLGDLNARHKDLGSHHTTNANGVRWKAFLDATDTAVLTGENVPTHVQGGRLDYVVLLNMPTFTATTFLDRSLLSDHFALTTALRVPTSATVPRKRLSVSSARLPHLVRHVTEWYSRVQGALAGPAALYEGLVGAIEGFVGATSPPPGRPRKSVSRAYPSAPQILHCQQMLAACQRRWQADPGDREAREAMVTVARHLTELRQEARKKYWEAFLCRVSSTRSLQEIWNHVNRVRGKSRRQIDDPDPAGKAQELVMQWKQVSSVAGLPAGHQEELLREKPRRMDLIRHSAALTDETCVPITHDELLCAVKRGKSTAPGRDGLTYDIINALIAERTVNPVLDLFNLSFATGQLPPAWKSALVVPIPKGDGNFRPISLTSCLCKVMERIMLNRLLYKVGAGLSGNMHGFLSGHSTSYCFVTSLSNKDATCRAFIDLKGAFDRANKDVIMEELVLKGVKGNLLRWIGDYLYGRTAQVWYQGAVSSEEPLELGTPQGGVLSPMLFNILMDRIARWPFPPGSQVVLYADDILIQCPSPNLLSICLQQLSTLCTQMGLVINESKTTFQANCRICCPPQINNVPLSRAPTHKYLGVPLSFKKSPTVAHVRDMCLSRLAPLRVLAHGGLGAGVPVLRLFYISVIRSLIDYAAPVLVQFSASQLRPLETLQNEAMRVILGCPRTAKIEVLRAELHLPSIVCRIQELTCRTVGRMLCTGFPSLKQSLVSLSGNPRSPSNVYLRKLMAALTGAGVIEAVLGLAQTPPRPPWRPTRVSVDIAKLPLPKSSYPPHVLQDMFMCKLSEYPQVQAVHVFCDGSVDGSKSGCGLFIRDYVSPVQYTDTEVSRRLPDHLSSTRAELYGILEALQHVASSLKDVFLFVDSQAALRGLLSPTAADCDLVTRCLKFISDLEDSGARVHFTWVPSHVGILFNDKADRLAQLALQDDAVDPGPEYTMQYVKRSLKDFVNSSITNDLIQGCDEGSASCLHYVRVSQGSDYTYGRHGTSQDVVAMRLRVGYKYYWEVSHSPAVCCALCAAPGGHTLHHYVGDCPTLARFRPPDPLDLQQLICFFLNHNTLKPILQQLPKFAPRW